MLIAYILSKGRFLKFKIVRSDDSEVFKKGKFEYKIDRQKIYQKKFFMIKTFFWSMYFEGNPNPIEFKEDSYKIPHDTPLDDIAYMMKKLKGVTTEIIMFALIGLNLVLSILILQQLYGVV